MSALSASAPDSVGVHRSAFIGVHRSAFISAHGRPSADTSAVLVSASVAVWLWRGVGVSECAVRRVFKRYFEVWGVVVGKQLLEASGTAVSGVKKK